MSAICRRGRGFGAPALRPPFAMPLPTRTMATADEAGESSESVPAARNPTGGLSEDLDTTQNELPHQACNLSQRGPRPGLGAIG